MNKTYKTYNARNAVKAAQVTNHIKAAKKIGISHEDAKAEAYRIYSIKAALPILKLSFKEVRKMTAPASVRISYPPLPVLKRDNLPPLPTIKVGPQYVASLMNQQ